MRPEKSISNWRGSTRTGTNISAIRLRIWKTTFPDDFFCSELDATIRDLEGKLGSLIDEGMEFDFTRSGDVLTIEFEDGEKIVITPQSPMEQLWISANYAGHRFNWLQDRSEWTNEKSGESLKRFLSKTLTAKLGIEANLD